MQPLQDLSYLVVDDFSTMRRIVRGLLRELGVTAIDEAEDGNHALQFLRTARYDMVICGQRLYDMRGIDLLRVIKACPEMEHTQFLIMLYDANKKDILLAAESGADGYIAKPFTAANLESKLHRIRARISLRFD